MNIQNVLYKFREKKTRQNNNTNAAGLFIFLFNELRSHRIIQFKYKMGAKVLNYAVTSITNNFGIFNFYLFELSSCLERLYTFCISFNFRQ